MVGGAGALIVGEVVKSLLALVVQYANRAGMKREELDALYEEEYAKGKENIPDRLPDTDTPGE